MDTVDSFDSDHDFVISSVDEFIDLDLTRPSTASANKIMVNAKTHNTACDDSNFIRKQRLRWSILTLSTAHRIYENV